ncbi:MAG: hypothetical protein M1816_000978 [Peltula sp. TS41687]|nr:MAG: hypothetical protein M1816_000978 [Peltula sp. TS41687]
MLRQKTAVAWAVLAVLRIQTTNAFSLLDLLGPARSNTIAANNAPTEPGPSDELSYCRKLPFRTDRGSLTPPDGTPKAIFVADGHITYKCQPPTDDSSNPQRSLPHLVISELSADLYDIGSVLKVNEGFVGPFLDQPTASQGHPRGVKVGKMVQQYPAELPRLTHNGRTFFRPSSVQKISASSNQPVGALRMVDREWALYSLNPINIRGAQRPVSRRVTELYEVKTVGGQVVNPYCVLGQKPITLPYKAQLWAYGDRDRSNAGVTDDKAIPDACSASRTLLIPGAK